MTSFRPFDRSHFATDGHLKSLIGLLPARTRSCHAGTAMSRTALSTAAWSTRLALSSPARSRHERMARRVSCMTRFCTLSREKRHKRQRANAQPVTPVIPSDGRVLGGVRVPASGTYSSALSRVSPDPGQPLLLQASRFQLVLYAQ